MKIKNEYSVLRINKNLKYFSFLTCLMIMIYMIYYVGSLWDDPNLSRFGLIIVYIIPCLILLIISIVYPIMHKIIIRDEYFEVVRFKAKKYFYENVSIVEIGTDSFKLINNDRTKFTFSWSYDYYDNVKETILSKIRESSYEVKFTYKKEFRGSYNHLKK